MYQLTYTTEPGNPVACEHNARLGFEALTLYVIDEGHKREDTHARLMNMGLIVSIRILVFFYQFDDD